MSGDRVNIYKCVTCRTGSLEMTESGRLSADSVTCRTGSLENIARIESHDNGVTCRTGSLIPIFSLKPCSTVIPAQAGIQCRAD